MPWSDSEDDVSEYVCSSPESTADELEQFSDEDLDDETCVPGTMSSPDEYTESPAPQPITFDPSLLDKIVAQEPDEGEVQAIEDEILQWDETNDIRDDNESESSDDEELFDGNRKSRDFYLQGMQNFNEDSYKRRHYAKGTLQLMANAEFFWKKFCSTILGKEAWRQCLKTIDFGALYHFLMWYLNQKTGRDGRAKRPVRAQSSLITFWCCFRIFYERMTTTKIDNALPRGVVHNALISLSKMFKLREDKKPNASMSLSDLKIHIETALQSTVQDFKIGEMRILFVLFLLLMAPAGSRPQSVLDLTFGDVDILYIRDPEHPAAPPRLTIRLRLRKTKQYRGKKPIKTFLVPEIMYDPSLLLSPHFFLLAVLIRNRAFEVESLNDNFLKLLTLKVSPNASEMRVRIKDKLQNVPIFRQSKRTIRGFEMAMNPITQTMTNGWMRRISQQAGFKHNTTAYTLRYFAGNSLDQNPNISTALRNLVLDHAPDSDTFQRHYLNRNICADLWATHRGLDPQSALIQQSTSHGGSRDTRRVFELKPHHIAEVKADRRYVKILQKLESTMVPSAERKELMRQKNLLFKKLQRKKLKTVMKEWTERQADEDVDRQVRGEDITATEASQGSQSSYRPAPPIDKIQKTMFDAMSAPVTTNLDAELERKKNALAAVVAFCAEEQGLWNIIADVKNPPPRPQELDTYQDPQEQLREIMKTVFVEGKNRRKAKIFRCFICVAKACELGQDHSRFNKLCRPFYDDRGQTGHFSSVHLDDLAEDEESECPVCHTALVDKNHLRAHAEDVHGICTDRVRPMRYRKGKARVMTPKPKAKPKTQK